MNVQGASVNLQYCSISQIQFFTTCSASPDQLGIMSTSGRDYDVFRGAWNTLSPIPGIGPTLVDFTGPCIGCYCANSETDSITRRATHIRDHNVSGYRAQRVRVEPWTGIAAVENLGPATFLGEKSVTWLAIFGKRAIGAIDVNLVRRTTGIAIDPSRHPIYDQTGAIQVVFIQACFFTVFHHVILIWHRGDDLVAAIR